MSLRPRMKPDEIHAAAQEARQRMRAGLQSANRPVEEAIDERKPREVEPVGDKLEALAAAYKGGGESKGPLLSGLLQRAEG